MMGTRLAAYKFTSTRLFGLVCFALTAWLFFAYLSYNPGKPDRSSLLNSDSSSGAPQDAKLGFTNSDAYQAKDNGYSFNTAFGIASNDTDAPREPILQNKLESNRELFHESYKTDRPTFLNTIVGSTSLNNDFPFDSMHPNTQSTFRRDSGLLLGDVASVSSATNKIPLKQSLDQNKNQRVRYLTESDTTGVVRTKYIVTR